MMEVNSGIHAISVSLLRSLCSWIDAVLTNMLIRFVPALPLLANHVMNGTYFVACLINTPATV